LVEFALVLPLLVLVLFGIVELGILLNIYIGMTNSAREGARAGAVYQYTGPATSSSASTTITNTIDTGRLQYLSQVITDTLNPIVDSTTVTVTVGYTTTTMLPANPYRAGDMIAVQLEHDHSLFFGLLGRERITIMATSAMRIEPGATK
jgi:Flp pilus assembly protein TadG